MELNEHIYQDSRIRDVMRHPAFDGKGRLLFPWDEPERYQDDMTMMDVSQMNLWHTNQDVNEMVGGVNRMIDDRADGKQVLFDIYTEEELAADSSKRNTGLFFFRGKPGMPFAVVCAGGGSCTGGCGTWIWCRKRYTGRRLDFSGNRLLEKEHEIVKYGGIQYMGKKILVVCYSFSNGNTRMIARQLQQALGADYTEIETVTPYPAYGGFNSKVVSQGQREVDEGFQPEIKPLSVNVADYDVVAIGTPTWWYTMAPAVLTFLNANDWSQKTVIPFMTHGGWPGHVIKDIQNGCVV